MTAERNRCRSEAADAGRQADRLTQRLNAIPKVPAPPACPSGLQRRMPKCSLCGRGPGLPTEPHLSKSTHAAVAAAEAGTRPTS